MSQLTQHRYPMVKAVLLFLAGIALFDAVALPVWALWAAFALCLLLTAVGLHSRVSNLYIAVALVLFGGVISSVRGFKVQTPLSERMYLALEVEDNPVIRKRFTTMPARIIEYEHLGKIYAADQRVNLYLDTLQRVEFGTHIEALGRIVPFAEKYGSYGRLMSRRGVAGTVFLRAEDVVKVEKPTKHTLRARAVERLSRLELSGNEAAVVGAIAVSDRRAMTTELRQAYARSGASHILAVSGLHVGIIFMICNFLLLWLSFVHYGQVIRAVAVIVPIWIYAAICGFPPSVVRAAVMFSVLQLTVATSSRYVSLNVLATTAFAMLVYRPDYLFDISFQLSFIAVGSIIVWGVPLMRALRSGRNWLDMLTATIIVGAVSSIATMPLVAHTFGTISLVGILLNPLVILCAYVIVPLAILWIAMPIPLLSGLFGVLLSGAGSALNFVVVQAASWRWSAVDVSLPAWAVWLIYGVAIALTAIARTIETKKSVPLSL